MFVSLSVLLKEPQLFNEAWDMIPDASPKKKEKKNWLPRHEKT